MPTVKIDSLEFRALIKKMLPFISKEESRYYLTGVFLEFDGKNTLVATATNGHILCHTKVRLLAGEEEFGVQEKASGIIPATALRHLQKIINKETGGLGALVTFDGATSLLFDFGDIQYRTKLIDGTYPDYKKVIPSGTAEINSGFNPKYLSAVINALDGQVVRVAADDKENAHCQPHLFSVAKDESEMKCVIMPMRA